jgi:outer membrane scaffolding protein for murein synthesis (MipA/OmpV family)
VLTGAAHSDVEDAERGGFHLSVGPGLYTTPLYPGARASRTRIFPFIDAEYDNRYYSNASDLVGVYAWKKEFSQAGAAIEFDPTERRARDDTRLAHLPDVRDTTRLKLFASRTVRFVTADGSVATDVLDRGHGTVAQANLWFTAPLTDHLSINVGPGVTWADARYMNSFYAVTTQEAALSSQLSAYSTHSGILDAHWNGLVEWQVFSHYRVGIQLSLMQLKGSAAASPLTEQRTQRNIVGWVAYTFR